MNTDGCDEKLDVLIQKEKENPSKTFKRAWEALWARRKDHPLLTFKKGRIDMGDKLALKALKNIDPLKTDRRSLVLAIRLLAQADDTIKEETFKFVRNSYASAKSGGLHDEKAFDEVWKTSLPQGPDPQGVMESHLQIAIESPDLIHKGIPAIMGKPVRTFAVDNGNIYFQLDFTHYLPSAQTKTLPLPTGENNEGTGIEYMEPVQFAVDCQTREITSNEGNGVLHKLLGEGQVLSFFIEDGGSQSMADLVHSENIALELRYDAKAQSWRNFSEASGIWSTVPNETAVLLLSRFIKKLLTPIKLHAEFLREFDKEYNWTLGRYQRSDYETEICLRDQGDQNDEPRPNEKPTAENDKKRDQGDQNDETRPNEKPTAENGKKRKQGDQNDETRGEKKPKTENGGTQDHLEEPENSSGTSNTSKAKQAWKAVKLLKDAITKYVETHRHTNEVLKSLQSMLETDFSMRQDMKHLLPCRNGVVDLKTGKLIGKAKPDDLFTHACPTEYDPDIDIWPVEQFYKTYFPCENNDDPVQVAQSQEFVRFMQIWLGYCITAETKLELCVWFYGRGSNGKTLLSKIVGDVLGNVEDHGVFSTLPADALSKERGVNNDSLSDAVDARHVFISETDKTMRINEAAFRSLVSAEPQHLKRMYKAEKSCKPNSKYTFAVNDLPQWKDADAYHTQHAEISIFHSKRHT